MIPNSPMRIKEILPLSADERSFHPVHSLKGQRCIFLETVLHPIYENEVALVRVGEDVHHMEFDWIETVLPRGGYF